MPLLPRGPQLYVEVAVRATSTGGCSAFLQALATQVSVTCRLRRESRTHKNNLCWRLLGDGPHRPSPHITPTPLQNILKSQR